MERKKFIKSLSLIALAPTLFILACKDGGKEQTTSAGKVQTYTCPMHPQIIQDKPGTCPICGMDLMGSPSATYWP